MKDDVVLHWHHIVPKYMGGKDDPSNLVQLTVEDHAIAHRVRWKLYGNHRDKWAWQILNGGITREELRREGCRDTQLRLAEEGRHNFQKKNDAHTPEGRKRRSERMMGNNYGSTKKITSKTKRLWSEAAKGNTNVRGRIWICNDATGEKRRVSPNDNIPPGFRQGFKLNVST